LALTPSNLLKQVQVSLPKVALENLQKNQAQPHQLPRQNRLLRNP
jgi:hypothetical protein